MENLPETHHKEVEHFLSVKTPVVHSFVCQSAVIVWYLYFVEYSGKQFMPECRERTRSSKAQFVVVNKIIGSEAANQPYTILWR